MLASILTLPAGTCLVEWPDLHFECRRAAVKPQQTCMFSPDVSATKLTLSFGVRLELEGQTTVNRQAWWPTTKCTSSSRGANRALTYCRQNTMHVKIEKEKRRKAGVYSAGQPLPSVLWNIDPCSWGLSLLCHTEGSFTAVEAFGSCAPRQMC